MSAIAREYASRALLIFFVSAMDVAERLDRLDVVRPLREQSLQLLLGLFAALQRVEIAGHLDRRIAMQGRTGGTRS